MAEIALIRLSLLWTKLAFWLKFETSSRDISPISLSSRYSTSLTSIPYFKNNFLIDSDFTDSSGLSLGFAEIDPGGDLILHYHSPAEIYVVTDGVGTLNKSGELEEIKKGDVVYIAGNEKHALKNNGKETLKFYWIFPTDRFSEVEYLY